MALTKVKGHIIADDLALGGNPTTSTQSASDNSTKIATTAYVTTAVSNLVDGAPSTLNTLNEIAAALNDDAALNTTLTNSIATKLPLAGGTMTGNLTVPYLATTSYIDLNNSGNRGKIGWSGNHTYIATTSSVGSVIFKNNVGSTDSPQTGGDTLLTIADGGNATFAGTISSGAITSSANLIASGYRVNEGNSLAGGLFKEKNVTGSGSSLDLSIFAESISNGGNIHFMTGGSATVKATIGSTGKITTRGTTATGYGVLEFGTININNNVTDGTVDFSQGLVFTDNSSNEGAWTHAGICSTGSSGYNGNLVFGTDGNSSRTSNVITERMRIDSAGDARFAANATGGALIKGVSGNQTDRNAGGYPQFTFVGNEGTGMRRVSSNVLAFDNSGAESMRIDDSGTVGIGTIPKTTNTFHADMFVGPSLYIANYSSGSNQQSVFGSNTYYAGGYKAVTGDTSASMVNFSQGNVSFEGAATVSADAAQTFTSKLYIKSDGNVGIGTNAPTNKLEIMGSSYDQIRIGSNHTDNTNKLAGIVSTTYTNQSVSVFQMFNQNGSNAIYYGSADGAHRGIQTHNFYVNTNYNSTSGHTRTLQLRADGDVHAAYTGSADTSGYFYAGKDWGAGNHRINRGVAQGGLVLVISAYNSSGQDTALFYGCTGQDANSQQTGLRMQKNSSNNRSINAAGTINASGSDYAEYVKKSDTCGAIAKGDICGIDVNSKITDKWSEAHSFVVKSTDPSYVGGDSWGTLKRPELTKQGHADPDNPADESDSEYAARTTQHETDLAAFETASEAERVKYDRIAFSGQVPCNLTGASVGDYIIPKEGTSDAITGEAVSTPTFEQYQKAIGKVWKVLDNGNAWISVKIG